MYRRKLTAAPTASPTTSEELASIEQCPIVQDGDRISGQVVIRQRSHTLEHGGIMIELVGMLERRRMPSNNSSGTFGPEEFIAQRLQLLPPSSPGEPYKKDPIILDFDFGTCHFPCASYDGNALTLRYTLKVVMKRKVAAGGDLSHEQTLWCPRDVSKNNNDNSAKGSREENTPLELEVGLEEFLHLKFSLPRKIYSLDEIVEGSLQFFMVRINVVDVELTLLRKEFDSNDNLLDQYVLTQTQVLDGPAYRGDFFQVMLDLASITDRLGPTRLHMRQLFSVKYFLALVLRDTEGRKYYKALEIVLIEPTASKVIYDVSTIQGNYKLGLVAN